MDLEDSFFNHFIAGALLIMGIVLGSLLLAGLIALWKAGFLVFIITFIILYVFAWVTHKAALFIERNDWFP
jgi:hypothetical protein